MPLPMEACKEDVLQPVLQDLPPGFDPRAVPSGMTEEPSSTRGA